jgi:uncharacterized protein (DUF58 family)
MSGFRYWSFKIISLPWRWMRWMALTRPIRFSRFGTFYILFTLGVGAAAINTGNNLLYLILGILLGFIIVSGVLSDSGLWGVRSEWQVQGSCYAGRPIKMIAKLSKGWFPSVALEVTSKWSGIPYVSQLLFWIPSRGTASLEWMLTPAKRGYLKLEEVRYASRFPFGLFEKSHRESRDEKWLVYPAVEKVHIDSKIQGGRHTASARSEKAGLGAVPFSLRDYRQGDSARRIHWKSTAKTGRMLVNEMEEESAQGDLLDIRRWPQNLSVQDQESFISWIASLAFTLHEKKRPVGLRAPNFYLAPDTSRETLHRLLCYLALLDLNAPTAPTPENTSFSAHSIDVLAAWERRSHAQRS